VHIAISKGLKVGARRLKEQEVAAALILNRKSGYVRTHALVGSGWQNWGMKPHPENIEELHAQALELVNKIGYSMNGEPREAVYLALYTLFYAFTVEDFGEEIAEELKALVNSFPSKLAKRAEDTKFWNLMFADYDPPAKFPNRKKATAGE
jgi:hypothetical protein